jgi:oligopeptide/dipeptide ABC transporter ATP-binding protein
MTIAYGSRSDRMPDPSARPLLSVLDLKKSFPQPSRLWDRMHRRAPRAVHALNGVSFSVRKGETLGIVGESGCGKSTLARCVVRLYTADSGRIEYEGTDVLALSGGDLRRYHRNVQMVFQDPYGSLNPRMTVGQVLTEALTVHQLRSKAEIPARVRELLNLVQLPPAAADRYPYEFSGGQRQRIGIARALSVQPKLLVADELVSALDVSIQAQVVNLLLELQETLHLTVLFIAHDLRLVRHVSHRVAVMYLGEIVELGETEHLFARPGHPYTAALWAAAPRLDPAARSRVEAVRGDLPSPITIPLGCPFHPRCPLAEARCRLEKPALTAREVGRMVACHVIGQSGQPPAGTMRGAE